MKIKAEKKYIFFIAFLCLFCISCNNGLTDTPKYSLSQVKSVIVLNKTEEDKKADECNLKINPSSYVKADIIILMTCTIEQ